ncbi:MAG: DUF2079 domain-containing protein [Leptolyngbyaceae cyanobacterium bins.59]|nr:DUF2079 domain-containing protein [Leptolyngbyaceae cyanobacterium bins.59]
MHLKFVPIKRSPLTILVTISTLILFFCSSLRHALFQSGAYDLGWFDQAVYLISRGQPPIVSFSGFHILGDHAAFIFYPLAILYWIYPNVHWLFAVQALALAGAAWPVWKLSVQAGLAERQAWLVTLAYLLYPLVFNINLFDFHPEVLAVPALLGAVLAARSGRLLWFCLSVALALSCKAVLSLTVAAMGLWLLLFEKRRGYGAIALGGGVAWFLITTQLVIPQFSGGEAAAVGRYRYLGNSVLEIATNLILKPNLVLGQLFSPGAIEYLALLLIPVAWGLSWRHLAPLFPALPQLTMNLLADHPSMRNLVHQYSLPILPFLILAGIACLVDPQVKTWRRQAILPLALVAFLALGKYGYFGSLYLSSLDSWQATRKAVALVTTDEPVLTTHGITTHLTHRSVIQFTIADSPPPDLTQYKYVLLDVRHPGWKSSSEFASQLVSQLKASPQFQLRYHQDPVFLFIRR